MFNIVPYNRNNENHKSEISYAVKPIKKELQLIGQIKPHKGHNVWEINQITLLIKEALFKNSTITYHPKKHLRKKRKEILVNKDCVYLSALNKKNALKQYLKLIK